MIQFIGNLPYLKIGNHCIQDYDTSWIKTALERMAKKSQQSDFPIEEIYQGIQIYLKEKCQSPAIEIEELFQKIRMILNNIHCQHLAKNLQNLTPPLTFSLLLQFQRAQNTYELGFFYQLQEITSFSRYGAEILQFTQIDQCVKALNGRERWSKKCSQSREEILTYLRNLSKETLEEKNNSITLRIL